MRVLTIIILVLVSLTVIAGMIFWYFTIQLKAPDPEEVAKSVLFEIRSGQGVKEVARNLEKDGLIQSAPAFEWYIWLEGLSSDIQAGKYQLKSSESLSAIVQKITKGDISSNEFNFQVLEGWTAKDIAQLYGQKLTKSLNQDAADLEDDFLRAVAVTDSRQLVPGESYDFLIDKPKTANLEGYLFPDTYRIYDDATPAEAIQKMLDNFDQKLTDELRQKIKTQGLTIFQGLTLASIVEKEVRTDKDRRLVADLFLRRMAQGLPLQSDATVNYVTGKSALQPSLDDTKVESSYNTYLYQGLPPGPICNPSLSSLSAVANPEPNEYLYYLNTPDGETIFSKTFEEHKLNKAKYLE